MSHCRKFGSLLEPYGDGELAPDKILEIEEHLECCQHCSARVSLDRSLRQSMRKVVYDSTPATPAFLARLGAALEAERARETEFMQRDSITAGRPLSWRVIAPLAAAAGFAMFWGMNHRQQQQEAARPEPAKMVAASAEPNVDQFVDDLIDYHLHAPAQPAVTEPAALQQFDPEVGVPVRLPRLQKYGARWEGGSVVPIRNRRAALLRYNMGSHKITLYVFDASRLPLERRLKQRLVRNQPVYVGYERGFSVAATERRGVGYAVATDLDDHESAEIIASLHTP